MEELVLIIQGDEELSKFYSFSVHTLFNHCPVHTRPFEILYDELDFKPFTKYSVCIQGFPVKLTII